jgi:aminoglycoside phosphotransferase (APT) family kinase protein
MSDSLLDLDALAQWLGDRGLAQGAVRAQPIGDGHSNPTFLVEDGNRRLVLRRPPPPPLPRGANDVLREARVLQALAGTDVPVPTVVAVAEAGELLDVPFYVMDHVDGAVCTESLPADLDDPAGHQGVGEALVDVLVSLEQVDLHAAGLDDFGNPDGYLDRQLERLPRLIAAADGSLPEPFALLRAELRATMPEPGRTGLVHGDLRLGNVMLARDAPPRILAVLDWELATIGDPLADLGYTLATYAQPDEPLHALTAMSAATLGDGFPTRAELARRYGDATGREISALPWYQTFALFKLAVLFEYSRRRGSDPYYQDRRHVDGLLAAADTALRMRRSIR